MILTAPKKFYFSILISLLTLVCVSNAFGASEEALLKKIKQLEKQNAALQNQVHALTQEKKSLIKEVKKGVEPTNQVEKTQALNTAEKKKIWKYNVGMGYTYRSGNDESQEGNLLIETTRETDKDKLFIGSTGLLGTDSQGNQVSKATGRTQYNRDINQDFYWLLLGSGDYDSAQKLDYRLFTGPGLGWKAIKSEKIDLNFEMGPVFESEKYASQYAANSLKGRLAQNFEFRFAEKAKAFQGVEIYGDPTVEDHYLINARAGVETGLTKFMNLRFTLQNQYNARPLPGTKDNDLSAVTSIIFNY